MQTLPELVVILLVSLVPCAIVLQQRYLHLRQQGKRFQFSLVRLLILFFGASIEIGVLVGWHERWKTVSMFFLLIFPTIVMGAACMELPVNADPDPELEREPGYEEESINEEKID